MGLIVPVMRKLGDRFARTGRCIDAEHLFSERVRITLGAVLVRRRRWDSPVPVLLACPEDEQHVLPLYGLAAALAEQRQPTHVLGGCVPEAALMSAVRRIRPLGVFLWAHDERTARRADLANLPRRRPPATVVVGGPGWRDLGLPAGVRRADTLTDAVHAVCPKLDIPTDVRTSD